MAEFRAEIREDLHRRFKALAATGGLTLAELLTQAIEAFLASDAPRPPRPVGAKDKERLIKLMETRGGAKPPSNVGVLRQRAAMRALNMRKARFLGLVRELGWSVNEAPNLSGGRLGALIVKEPKS